MALTHHQLHAFRYAACSDYFLAELRQPHLHGHMLSCQHGYINLGQHITAPRIHMRAKLSPSDRPRYTPPTTDKASPAQD
jgi:hypothetical protein